MTHATDVGRAAASAAGGRTALVTGGGSGIGRATATALRESGFDVVIADIDLRSAQRAASALDGEAVALDVTDLTAWQELAGSLVDRPSPLVHLALNAGLAGGGRELTEFDVDRYRALWEVNVNGVLFGLRSLLPLLGGNAGAATIMCSVAGLTGIPFDPLYAMTKHALIGLVRSCADDLAGRGVRLQAVCPGLVDTPLLGEGRAQLDEVGFPLLTAADVGQVVTACATGRISDPVLVCQPGRDPVPYRFAGLPGARMTGGHVLPALPADLRLG
jgi:NAD(P)-dependent dehydrogenase (short-subunit alcohol dehydrogenase family)